MARPNPAAREAVVTAARELMTARGYVATTVDLICETAGVTKGTFFHYFGSKEEVAAAALEDYCKQARATIHQAPFFSNPDPSRRFDGFIDFVPNTDKPSLYGGIEAPTKRSNGVGIALLAAAALENGDKLWAHQ